MIYANTFNPDTSILDGIIAKAQNQDISKDEIEIDQSVKELSHIEILEKFPGAIIKGDGKAFIGENVRIHQGAILDLRNCKPVISGETQVFSGAKVSGGEINYSTIRGQVEGGLVYKTEVSKTGKIQDGRIIHSQIDGTVKDGLVGCSYIEKNGLVKNGVLMFSQVCAHGEVEFGHNINAVIGPKRQGFFSCIGGLFTQRRS